MNFITYLSNIMLQVAVHILPHNLLLRSVGPLGCKLPSLPCYSEYEDWVFVPNECAVSFCRSHGSLTGMRTGKATLFK